MKKLVLKSFACFVVACSQTATECRSQGLIASANLNLSIGIPGNFSSITPLLRIDDYLYESSASVFSGVSIDAGSVGNVYTANAGNDPGFPEVAVRLTDGKINWVSLALPVWGFVGSGAEDYTFGLYPLGTRTDLNGYRIDSIDMRIDRFDLSNVDNETLIALHATFSLYGSVVPEPTVVGLICTAFLGFVVKMMATRKEATKGSEKGSVLTIDK